MAEHHTSSLQDLVDATPNLVDYFYHDTLAPHSRERGALTPVPDEFSNWREEQRAWRETAVLFDQSHHMPELFLSGPDAFKLLNYLGINSFEKFVPGMAKQFVCCGPDGYLIGDCVLFYLAEDEFELVSGMTLLDWVEFNSLVGGYDVTVRRDHPTSLNPGGRIRFRFGLDGPNAQEIFSEAVEGPAPEIPFFRFANVKIAGCDVIALRHGMAGHKGVELAGAYADGPKVRAALLEIGRKYGIRPGGRVTYFSATLESGWMAYPLPAIYSQPGLRPFREWLASDGWEARTQIAGSFRSDRIEDYYNDLWELGYGRILKFDHDFVGREALEKKAGEPHRKKVTLVWDDASVREAFGSLVRSEGLPYKYMSLPNAQYGFPQCDEVRTADGQLVGLSNLTGYTSNERKILSLGMVEEEYGAPGTELVLVWGEPDGGSRKPHVERHAQQQVRVTVGPVPYAESARKMKQSGFSKVAQTA